MTALRGGFAVFVLLAVGAGGPLPLLGQEAPEYLPDNLAPKFDTYSQQPSHRAFALGRTGWGTAYGHSSLQTAREAALSNCRTYADQCVVIAEDDEIVRSENPFPEPSDQDPFLAYVEAFSPRATLFLALAALALLVAGTRLAEKYPLYLFDTGLSDALRLRLNYTIVPFGFLYFTLMLPTFFRLGDGDFSNPLTWIVFASPILPYVVSILYLRQKNKLSDRFELK